MYLYAKRQGPKTADDTPENQQCTNARRNVELLEGKNILRRDTNGDGVPDQDLDENDRATQLQLARMVLKTNCAKATAGKSPANKP